MLPTTREMLLAFDAQRPRTQQKEMGMSALGGCRRAAGYELAGYEPDDDWVNEKVQAVMGTAIHEAAAAGAVILLPAAHAESLTVRFGGLLGHLDLYYQGIVRDIKTKGYSMQIETIRAKGPPQANRYQVHCYGAGLIMAGYEVHTVQLDYLARDSGEEYLFEEPFDPDVVDEAMSWLKTVREAEPEMLPRDYRPDSKVCQSCPFFQRCWRQHREDKGRKVLFLDDPDAAKWGQRLRDAQELAATAKSEIEDAKGAMDHLRSVFRPGDSEDVAVPGLDWVIHFSVTRGRSTPDMEQIADDYKRAGSQPPYKLGEPSVRLSLRAKHDDEE